MNKRIYLDYASATPIDKKVFSAMKPYFTDTFANPASLYIEGVEIKKKIKECREVIAKFLNIRNDGLVFTGSGTESCNLAIEGVILAWPNKSVPHVITTNIEHPAILETCRHLEKMGVEVTYIKVEENGIVNPDKIFKAIKENTVLVTVMLANNEIGTIQPIREISRLIQEYKKNRKKNNLDNSEYPYLHTDASQAVNYLDLSFQKHGVDMMTLDSAKFYGPKGVGLLALRYGVNIKSIIFGGGQEGGLRSGTENTAGIVGFTKALQIAQSLREKESARVEKLRDYFVDKLEKLIPSVFINGDKVKRLPNNINFCVPGLDAEFAVIKLDHVGIACASGSACANLKSDTFSYVVEALGEKGKACRASSLRFTLGRGTNKKEIDLTVKKIQSIINNK